jgi:thiamine kinase-like enzyme
VLRNAPERKEEIVRDYAQFLRKVHAVEMEPGELPDMREVYRGYLDRIRHLLPGELYSRLLSLLSEMPENLHAIHGDIHMKNIMLDGEEPLLIDMEALAVGDPVFDLQGVFVTYQLFGEDDPGNSMSFLGISQELADYIWEKTMEFYFRGRDAALLREAERKTRIAAYVRFLWLIVEYEAAEDPLTKLRVRHTLEHLRELVPTVDSLAIGD